MRACIEVRRMRAAVGGAWVATLPYEYCLRNRLQSMPSAGMTAKDAMAHAAVKWPGYPFLIYTRAK